MEVTALRIRLLISVLFLLCALNQKAYSVFLRVDPNRLQFFEYEPVTFHCEGVKGAVHSCRTTSSLASKQLSCNIKNIFLEDSGEYWCEAEGGERSNSVNITVTEHSVILESPALPVMEGEAVNLSCRNKTASFNLQTDFYRNGCHISSSSTGEMTLHSVSKSDEGLYKCSITGVGESPETWLSVRVLLYLSTLTPGSGLPEDQTVSVETSAADAKVAYAVVTKNRRKKDEDEFASRPIYYTLGLGDTEHLAEHAAVINPSYTENALYSSI
ncbi:high affinity immunoglobulin gamma Fc receptor I-like isoform X4 [Sander lucioperca]|uniref:high affinity immunoglobulin gamma Fc receptor I-like isoform X4 n=1 Tax=Sander lucioperca TaxID=283035 RepID=UPI00125D4BAA|nr:high affinity immunoglobulin gamma Fc receptor I-like isoform X4 [Sander lucioperca]